MGMRKALTLRRPQWLSGRAEKLIADIDRGVASQRVGTPWPIKWPRLREIEHHRLVWKTEAGEPATVSGATVSACGPDVHDLRVGIPMVNISERQGALPVDEHAKSNGEVSGQIVSHSCLSGQSGQARWLVRQRMSVA